MMRSWYLAGLAASWLIVVAGSIAHFEVSTLSDTSMVIRMIEAHNVTRFDMRVQIFDIDRLVEFRRTELSGSSKDQLFAFDGLTPHTWFAFRIRYRLVFQAANEYSDIETKQELVVRTHNNTREDPSVVDDQVTFIDEVFSDPRNVYISVSSVFKAKKQVHTVIVPELRCQGGLLKTLAQQVVHHARFHFDLTAGMNDENNLTREKNRIRQCSRLCIFPYIRVDIKNSTSETFRARHWCGSLEEAKKDALQRGSRSVSNVIVAVAIATTISLLLFFL